jgi:hypothetical protein
MLGNAVMDVFIIAYSWLNQNLVEPIVSFARGFELGVLVLASIVFILIVGLVLLRQAKRLPRSYKIEIIDVFGREDTNSGLRQHFQTYEAAESYAKEYRRIDGKSRFRVVGIQ